MWEQKLIPYSEKLNYILFLKIDFAEMDFSYWNLSFDSLAFQSENDLGSEKEMETSPGKTSSYLIAEVCRIESL